MKSALFLCLVLILNTSSGGTVNSPDFIDNERYGFEVNISTAFKEANHVGRLDEVLLIPESGNDVVGMYDPYDGTYLGDLIVNDTLGVQYSFATPINAVPGPDYNIYVSDQISDAIFVFDTTGEYLYTYADTSDGLNNIRGIDFRDGHLFVTSGDDYVREFSGPHAFVRDFIADGSDPFDILFLDDGRALLSDIAGNDISLYDTNGTMIAELFEVNFPEQTQFDAVLPGAFLNASFTSDLIIDFDLTGITASFGFSDGRGVYRLGNGNILATNGSGVYELDSLTGAIVEQQNTGSCRFIELYAPPTAVHENTLLDKECPGVAVCPNPFTASVQITLSSSQAGRIEAAVYDVKGSLVTVLMDQSASAGKHTLVWHCRDFRGVAVQEGVYFLRVGTPLGSVSTKLVLLRQR